MEPVTQDLHIIIIEALNLYGKDFDNKSTPIAKVRVISSDHFIHCLGRIWVSSFYDRQGNARTHQKLYMVEFFLYFVCLQLVLY